jgi:PilZ domain
VLQPTPYDDQREEPRVDVHFRTVLIESEIFGEQVHIVNIARRGFLARTRSDYETGADISVHLPNVGETPATVVWCANGLIGGRFHDAIEEQDFAELLVRLA